MTKMNEISKIEITPMISTSSAEKAVTNMAFPIHILYFSSSYLSAVFIDWQY